MHRIFFPKKMSLFSQVSQQAEGIANYNNFMIFFWDGLEELDIVVNLINYKQS